MVFPGFYEASGTSTRNRPSEPTTSKPVVPGAAPILARGASLCARMPGALEARREQVRRRFAMGDAWFATSPLYRVLARAVARDDALLDLAGESRSGQQPPNMLMAASHLLVLRDPSLPFARFFASVRGEESEPPAAAGAEFAAFCAEHREALLAILRTRLVQTSAPGRAVSVRLGLHEVARRVDGPVTFLEVGPGAGVQLRFDRWAVETAGRRFGPRDAPVVLRPEWRGERPLPDLDALPPVRERLGVDLHRVDVTDPEERLWLKALVWPEHRDRLGELEAALDAVAADPPEILEGDAIELLPRLDRERLAHDVPVVVFHSMVRAHVPPERREAFDVAIAGLGDRRRLLHLSLEGARDLRGHRLRLQDSEGPDGDLALAEGHGRWIAPLPAGGRGGA